MAACESACWVPHDEETNAVSSPQTRRAVSTTRLSFRSWSAGVTITAEPGQIIAPPPDGASYLGFIFARAASPADAETALRIAHCRLHFDIRPEYPAMEVPTAERT